MSDDKQAVVEETKVAAVPAATVETRTEDVDPLDKLLAEFDQGTKPAEPVSPPEKQQPQAPTLDPATAERIRRLDQRLIEEDVNDAVKQIFGDESKVSKRVAKGWLDQIARENPGIANAFLKRETDPRTWNRFVKSLQKEVEKDFPPSVDTQATEDREAVAAAVRGASKPVAAEPAPNFGQMSAAEGRKFVQKQYGFDPGW